jgi:hypothetical protein
MFTLFTPSQFGRGLTSTSTETSHLATYLAAYRRQRAREAKASVSYTVPVARAA